MGQCISNNTKLQHQYQKPRDKALSINRPNNQVAATCVNFEDIRKIYKFDQKILGTGTFGTVRIGKMIQGGDDKKFAIKSINLKKMQKDYQLLVNELKILQKLDHPNVIRFYEVYQDEHFIHYVMQYCGGGEILERIVSKGQLNEQEISNIMNHVLTGVAYLHEKGICHRDLKLENPLFEDKSKNAEINIVDFGLSYIFKEYDTQKDKWIFKENQSQFVGTPLYMAPEVINRDYDYRCDLWSIGVILYMLLCGQPPFYSSNKTDLFKKICNGRVSFDDQAFKQISQSAIDLCKKLLNKKPDQRITARQALEHPWFKVEANKNAITQSNQHFDKNVFDLLKNFRGAYRFKKEVLRVMINFLDEKQIKQIKHQFKLIDKDHTGMINIDELRQIMLEQGHLESEEQIRQIMITMNLNDNDSIDYSEFIASLMDSKFYLNEENLFNAFKHFDEDNSGFITISNLKNVLNRSGRKFKQEDLEMWIKEMDILQNNKIDFDEFKQFMHIQQKSQLQNGQSTSTIIGEQNEKTQAENIFETIKLPQDKEKLK